MNVAEDIILVCVFTLTPMTVETSITKTPNIITVYTIHVHWNRNNKTKLQCKRQISDTLNALFQARACTRVEPPMD